MAEPVGDGLTQLAEHVEGLSETEVIKLADHNGGRWDTSVLAVPKGRTLHSVQKFLDEARDMPRRRVGQSSVRSARALIDFTNRYKNAETSVLFASPDRKAPSITTVFDFHPQSSDHLDAGWGEHRCRYVCELSHEWQAWQAMHGKTVDQVTFAQFVEDRVADVVAVDPNDERLSAFAALMSGTYATPGELITLSRGLQISSDIKVREAVSLSTGVISVMYEETHSRTGAGAPQTIPNLFVLRLPVFLAGPLFFVIARLRYALTPNGLRWSVHLHRTEQIFDDAFSQTIDEVREGTELPVFLGYAPESE